MSSRHFSQKQSEELLELLRTKMEIPENIKSLEIRMAFNEVLTAKADYFPAPKEENP